tara:strand:- start:658 stop:789 length:132 start_codon:yes stop_codon:yes gene_type:complete
VVVRYPALLLAVSLKQKLGIPGVSLYHRGLFVAASVAPTKELA